MVSVVIGLVCIGGVVREYRGEGAGVTVDDAAHVRPPEAKPAAAGSKVAGASPRNLAQLHEEARQDCVGLPTQSCLAPAARPSTAAADIDMDLATGSIGPGSALHHPNPGAYADAARAGAPSTVTGAEAINYLAGNTLRREGPGEPLHFTYFASRGLMGEGDERGFTARRWDRERPELCETGRGGGALCRSVSILLDGKYEFPGSRLGAVTLGAAGGEPAVTAVLVKGNAIRFPEHIPFLDSTVDVATAGEAAPGDRAKGGDPAEALAGHPVAVVADRAGARGRQIVYYAKDNRRLELQQVQVGDGVAVQVTVGHWRIAKASLCQIRATGAAAQSCFKVEPAANGLRLVPAGKAGDAQTLTLLPETGAREVAQD